MRILLLTPRLPWPPIDGGRIAMARLAESLAHAGAEVDVLSLNPRKHRGEPAGPLPVEAIDIDTSRAIAPLFKQEPFIVARFISDAFRDAVRRRNADIVQIESPFMLPYARDVRDARIVLRSLNVEFRIWEGLAKRSLAARFVAASLRRYEIAHLNTPDAIVPISHADAADYRRLGCTRPMYVVPCGIATGDAGTPEPNRAGFIGSLDFRPNQEAVRWLADELWPRVLQRMPEAKLSIAGTGALPKRTFGPSIEFLGHVPDAQAFMRRMSVMLAPLFAGGGMRIKVLEAMALAKPVVATTLGAGGVDVEHVAIANDVDSFADAVVRLLRDPNAAKQLGAAARAQVAERYDNDTLGRELIAFYEALLRRA